MAAEGGRTRLARLAPACAAFLLVLCGCTNGMTPLHKAVLERDEATVRSWVAGKRGLDPAYDEPTRGLEGNYARRLGITPLMMAAGAGDERIVRLLVEGGANVRARSDTQVPGEPMLPFDFAASAGDPAAAKLLWERTPHADLEPRLGKHLARAISAGRPEMAMFLIGVTPQAQLALGIGEGICYAQDPARAVAFARPLVPAFPAGTLDCLARFVRQDLRKSLEAAGQMLDHGVPLDQLTFDATPLMRAAQAGNAPMVDLLLARGARTDVRNSRGLDAAAYAANDQCFGGGPGLGPHEERKVALIERLAGNVPRPPGDASVLATCCRTGRGSAAQDRVCKLFGL